MTPDHRAFNERYAALWQGRADARRLSGQPVDLAIAGALDRIVAGLRAELAAAGPAETVMVEPDDDKITWRSPVFNAGGRFNPFAGTYAEAMLASADACDRLGYRNIGDSYRARAAQGSEAIVTAAPARRPPRPIWSGPNLPPPEPVPFTAGEQMGFAL